MQIKAFIQKNIPVPTVVFFFLGVLCAICKVVSALSTPFADFFNRHVASAFRAASATLTSILPFSVAETMLICLVPCAILYLVWCFTVAAKRDTLVRQIFILLGVICLLFSLFMLTFGIAYDTTPLEDEIGLSVTDPSADALYEASAKTLLALAKAEKSIVRAENGAAPMPYTFHTMVDKLNAAYDTLYAEYEFLSPLHAPVKRIALSRPMTYTHISGVYTFWSGEANVNVNYPDYVVVFSTAHEMAHQRGIAPEDEANFVAYLACAASDDPYIRYCGHANMLEYLASALYDADAERYANELLPFYPAGLRAEYTAYAEMFKPYRDSAASEVSGAVNDVYLKVQGETEGTKSYGLVVDLAVAYLTTVKQ